MNYSDAILTADKDLLVEFLTGSSQKALVHTMAFLLSEEANNKLLECMSVNAAFQIKKEVIQIKSAAEELETKFRMLTQS